MNPVKSRDDLDPDPLTLISAVSGALAALAAVYQCYQSRNQNRRSDSSTSLYALDTIDQLEDSLYHLRRVSDRIVGLFGRKDRKGGRHLDKHQEEVRFGNVNDDFSERDMRRLQNYYSQLYMYCGSISALSMQLGRITGRSEIKLDEYSIELLSDIPNRLNKIFFESSSIMDSEEKLFDTIENAYRAIRGIRLSVERLR